MTQRDESDSDDVMRVAAQAGAQWFDAMERPEVMAASFAAAEAMGRWALELLRAGIPPESVAGTVGGGAASAALVTCAQWANGDLR